MAEFLIALGLAVIVTIFVWLAGYFCFWLISRRQDG